jgi:hypothetical protein
LLCATMPQCWFFKRCPPFANAMGSYPALCGPFPQQTPHLTTTL